MWPVGKSFNFFPNWKWCLYSLGIGLLEGLTEMIICKMISAVSKNPINNYYCDYYWMMDYFTPIILLSEDHYCFNDMTGLIKSLGFGDWWMRLRPCSTATQLLGDLEHSEEPLNPWSRSQVPALEDLTASEEYPSGQVGISTTNR